MWHFVGVFPHEHAQCATWINYRISRCNFIADWTIVLWKISIAGLTLATSQLATTDLLEHSHHPGPDFIFPKQSIGGGGGGGGNVVEGFFQHSWVSKWPFPHYNQAEYTVFCHTYLKMFKEKKNKTSTKAYPAFVSSA